VVRSDSECVGGPNFDPKTLEYDALTKRGYTSSEIKIAQSQLCITMVEFETYPKLHTKALNITWNLAGASEVCLKRKLKHHKISLDDKTLGFSTFFMFLGNVYIIRSHCASIVILFIPSNPSPYQPNRSSMT
jgi:hypothetical protein